MSSGIRSLWRAKPPIASRTAAVAISRPAPRQVKCLPPACHVAARRFTSSLLPGALIATTDDPPSASEHEVSFKDSDLEPWGGSNYERNAFQRNAFRKADPEDIKDQLPSPFVPSIREYPTPSAQKLAIAEAEYWARIQAGHHTVWRHYIGESHYVLTKLGWRDIVEQLKLMTPPRTKTSNRISAMRIVLPKSWDLDFSKQDVDYVNSYTGLIERLRVFKDHVNTSSLVVRGRSEALAKAADELLAINDEIKVFELGEISALDYLTKQLWPSLENAVDEHGDVHQSESDSIWVHREPAKYWIETRYEDIPRPDKWTVDTFYDYISKLVNGRVRPHLARPLYSFLQNGHDHARLRDLDGIRIKLMMSAIKDPEARSSITPPALKMALSLMARSGGHRADADELYKLAEEWGLPLDSELFNILLEGYVVKRDFRAFYKFLRKMKTRLFQANERTWLLFLQLAEKDEVRRQIIVEMYSLNLMVNPAVGYGIAAIMSSSDAYTALRSGKELDKFIADQDLRYGRKWFSYDALNRILKEFFLLRGHLKLPPAVYSDLVKMRPYSGPEMDISTPNIILKSTTSRLSQNWGTAFAALKLIVEEGLETDDHTFDHLLELAALTSRPNVLSALIFLGANERKLRFHARNMIRRVLIGRHSNGFWFYNRVPMFTADMAQQMETPPFLVPRGSVRKAIATVARSTEGMRPTRSIYEIIHSAYLLDEELKAGGKAGRLEIEMETVQKDEDGAVLEHNTDSPTIRTFRLDRVFEPRTMIVGFSPRHRRAKYSPLLNSEGGTRGLAPPAASSDAAPEGQEAAATAPSTATDGEDLVESDQLQQNSSTINLSEFMEQETPADPPVNKDLTPEELARKQAEWASFESSVVGILKDSAAATSTPVWRRSKPPSGGHKSEKKETS